MNAIEIDWSIIYEIAVLAKSISVKTWLWLGYIFMGWVMFYSPIWVFYRLRMLTLLISILTPEIINCANLRLI